MEVHLLPSKTRLLLLMPHSLQARGACDLAAWLMRWVKMMGLVMVSGAKCGCNSMFNDGFVWCPKDFEMMNAWFMIL